MSHGAHVDSHDPFQRRVAVAIAIYTVVLAFANMLTNQARTEAILSSNRATNKWSHFQSKSTKQNMVRLEQHLLQATGDERVAALERLDAEAERYEAEKEELRVEAEALASEEHQLERKESRFEYAATTAELGIVLAGLALLMTSRKMLYTSMVVATVSLGLVGATAFSSHGEQHQAEHAAPARGVAQQH